MKAQMLKIAGVKNQKEFYKLFPTEESFMKVHGKEFKKALLGSKVRQAQQGTNEAFNQLNAGMNNAAATAADVQGAISNVSTGKSKQTVGQALSQGTKDIPILGSLVSGITGLFDAANERKQQVRAGALSDLQLAASKSAPREQNRKYNRPDLDANVADINSLMPAEGTGTNLLGRYGVTISRNGKEIPEADWGAILSSVLGSGSSGSGGSGGGLLSGVLGSLLGGGSKPTKEEQLAEADKYVTRSRYSPDRMSYYATAKYRPQDLGTSYVPQAQSGDWVGKILGGENGGVSGMISGALTGGKNKTGNLVTNQSLSNNIEQGAQSLGSGLDAIPGMDTKMAQSSKQIGETVGSVIPLPGASAVLGGLAQGIGAIAENKSGKKALEKIERNNQQMAATQAAKAIGTANNKFMRAGGNLRQNTPDMEQSGELNTLWGGHAEPMSYNPYLPDGGETVMFRGNSHDEGSNGRTGIGVRYGEDGGNLQPYDANVEVEAGEPAVQLPDETGEKNLVVFGNLPIPKQFVSQLGDPKAKGKKFKSYVALLSKDEQKQNKIMEKANDELLELDPKTPFEKIKFDTLALNIKGANQKLKDIAQKKTNAAHLQQAINDTAEERGIDAEQLAKGRIKAAKGAKVAKAQYGGVYTTEDDRDRMKNRYRERKESTGPMVSFTHTAQGKGKLDWSTPDEAGGVWAGDKYKKEWIPRVDRAFSNPAIAENILNAIENYTGTDADDVKAIIAKEPTRDKKIERAHYLAKEGKVGPYHQIIRPYVMGEDIQPRMEQPSPSMVYTPNTPAISPAKVDSAPAEQKSFPQYINPLSPYLPSNMEELDPRQLTGEYFALATNQLEPVPAQLYHPDLKTPYEISLQDILNENTAATRAAQRFMGYNPAAQASLMGQQYQANQKVLADQFRINQELKDKVYSENINTLNDAQLKNLGILDRQYERQAQAKSKTKDVAREALSSISDKYLQNQLSNRTLATYENLYNYRYDPRFRTWNTNPPAQFNMSGSGGESAGWEALTPEEKQIALEEAQLRRAREEKKKTKKERNGAILKAMRNS